AATQQETAGAGPAETPGQTTAQDPESGPPVAPADDDVAASAAYQDLRHAEQGSTSWTTTDPAIGLAGAAEHVWDREVWGMGLEPGTLLGRRYALEELLAQRGDLLEYWSATDSTLERL